MNDLTWKIAGEAGYGIMVSGLIFAKSFSRSGYHVFDTNEYPSLIRGGHNTYTVRISAEEIFSHGKGVDILIALNKDAVDLHEKEMNENGMIIYDSEETAVDKKNIRKDISLLPVPLLKLAKGSGGEKIMINTVALGASAALTDSMDKLIDLIKEAFGGRGKAEEIVNVNIKAAQAGYDYVKKNFKKSFNLKKINTKPKLLLTGNDAVCLGAIKSGCKYLAEYPMTPVNSILHYMAAKEREANLIVHQPEDEISGINSAIGASFSGARSMVATSGGGFSLMVEALGSAAQTETPLVIVEGQRPGPATGLPTHTSQGDLQFMLHAAQGEFPRVVITPGDMEECFYESFNAFNLAEKYQLPVIILLDKFICESHKTVDEFDLNLKIDRGLMLTDSQLAKIKDFKRYEFTESGVSPRSLPGQKNGIFIGNSDEHNEYSYMDESAENRKDMTDKKFRKLNSLLKEIKEPELYGKEKADITLVGWGSTKLPVLEAMKLLGKKVSVNFLHFVYAYPLQTKKLLEVFEKAKKTVIIEGNKTAQFANLIREYTGKEFDYKILKYDGRPFYPEEIVENITKISKGKSVDVIEVVTSG